MIITLFVGITILLAYKMGYDIGKIKGHERTMIALIHKAKDLIEKGITDSFSSEPMYTPEFYKGSFQMAMKLLDGKMKIIQVNKDPDVKTLF